MATLKHVLHASGVAHQEHLVGVELGDLTIPAGITLTAPIKALLRSAAQRASTGMEVG